MLINTMWLDALLWYYELILCNGVHYLGVLVAIVKDQPVAVNHFASYLRQNREFDELIKFYE